MSSKSSISKQKAIENAKIRRRKQNQENHLRIVSSPEEILPISKLSISENIFPEDFLLQGKVEPKREDIDLYSEGAEHLLLKSHIGIGIKRTDNKVMLARNKMVDDVTNVINDWLIDNSVEFMIKAYSYSQYLDAPSFPYETHLQLSRNNFRDDSSFRDMLNNFSFRLITLKTHPLGVGPPRDIGERIKQLSTVKFEVLFQTNSVNKFMSYPDYIIDIPDEVKNAIKIKILLDFFILGTSLKEEQIIKCDFFLNRVSAGLLHKDSAIYDSTKIIPSPISNIQDNV